MQSTTTRKTTDSTPQPSQPDRERLRAAERQITLDANEAVAQIAHKVSEVIALYPITPASSMGEHCDEYSSKGKKNLWGQVPRIIEMQSEAGAAGTVHGALMAGSLATTFTASQGLLLMIPNMYKIAGEFHPFVLHVAARTIATHALSIFGDHSDVMACRGTGFAMLCASSVQEAQDMAAIAHAATLRSRVPFVHFFDGFRTSHEVSKITSIDDSTLAELMSDELVQSHRSRALTPDHPSLRGSAQNPDTFFQAREAGNLFYLQCPEIVRSTMLQFEALTGRAYDLFEYVGDPDADRVIVAMGSGCETIQETLEALRARGEKVGLVKVHLYRPLDVPSFLRCLPRSVQSIAVLDRVKEPGAVADPLFLDVLAALQEGQCLPELARTSVPRVIGGRYGLSSKEFTPAMVKAVYDELAKSQPKRRFTVGIEDDVTHLSLKVDESFDAEGPDVVRAVFFGLGSDGTVGSNKNTIKIIGEETSNYAQGYFVYDSRKSGAITVSHLRFGPRPIRSCYQIRLADYVACHQPQFIDRYEMVELAKPGATFVWNTPFDATEAWSVLPREVQEILIARRVKFYVIDAQRVAEEAGLGRYISTVMQACFFALSGVLPREVSIEKMKTSIQKTYGKRGVEVVNRNLAAVERALEHLHAVEVPAVATSTTSRPAFVDGKAPDFIQRVTGVMLAGHGDRLPVSAFPVDGRWPVGTSPYDRRSLALEMPVWDANVCIQCNKCALICPHAAIRATVFDPAAASGAPETFKSVPFKGNDYAGMQYRIQVAPDDCTGCSLCVNFCPAKDKSNPRHKAIDMAPANPLKPAERVNFDYFTSLPLPDRTKAHHDVKGSQFLEPLFEFSGACAGCGETPYLKLMSQLFGDRALVANATGCSSIYGGNLPTTPWKANRDGCGPAWANSLFEDNAEFGLGFRLSVDAQGRYAKQLLQSLAGEIGDELVTALLNAEQSNDAQIGEQRERVRLLKSRLERMNAPTARRLLAVADYLVRKSIWIIGGDGWAYDIGYGGLDHVLSTGEDVNILVVDTEVYSNTGGQQSKATPMGAAAKFAAAGKELGKKDLGLLAMSYGHVYVASVAMGAKDAQTVKAFAEAESYPGPSLIIAYSHCIAHGYDLAHGADQQKLAVDTGVWPLYRFDPRRLLTHEPPLQLDSPPPKRPAREYTRNEGRFRMVELADPKRYEKLLHRAERDAQARRLLYEQLANVRLTQNHSANGSNTPPASKS